MSYKLVEDFVGVMRLADKAHIPNDNGNRHWQKYQAWLAEGNTPEASDKPTRAELDRRAEVEGAGGVARQWLAGNRPAVDFLRLTPMQQEAQIDAMLSVVQMRELIKALTVAVSALVKERWL